MLAAAVLAAALLAGGTAQDAPLAPLAVPVTCATGPVEREYGGLTWQVFGCSNGAVLFGGKPETVAASSLFMWAPSGAGFELTLESSLEDRTPLVNAATELAALTPADLQVLLSAARDATP